MDEGICLICSTWQNSEYPHICIPKDCTQAAINHFMDTLKINLKYSEVLV